MIEIEVMAKLQNPFLRKSILTLYSGYNWGSVSTETTETLQTFEVSAVAPAGTVLLIDQARNR